VNFRKECHMAIGNIINRMMKLGRKDLLRMELKQVIGKVITN